MATPQKPGRKPGQGPFCYRAAPEPATLTGPPTEVAVTLTVCPAWGGQLEEIGVERASVTELPEPVRQFRRVAVRWLSNNKEEEMKIPPQPVIDMLASRPHRMHHFIWHQVRNAWHLYPAEVRAEITRLGWNPPRPAFYDGNVLALDNYSGEDFLYMHHQMIRQVNEMLAQIDDPNYPAVEPWATLPLPGNPDFPVPPAWNTGDDNLQRFSDE